MLLAALAILGLAAGQASASHLGRPNILIILTDDQRADGTMDVMPQTRSWFESGGTKFSQAFASTPMCCPARASIFSGRYTHNHGVRTNDSSATLDQRFTIQAYLKAAGYRTAIFGKYMNAWNLIRNPPNFDDWSISVAGYSPFRVNENGVVKGISQYATSYFKDNAVRFINESETQDATPWFLEVSTTAPHAPFTPEAAYASAPVPPFNQTPSYFEADKRDKPLFIENELDDATQIQTDRTAQLRTLMSVDDLVQQVFTTLEADGEAENTLAIFLSDNGYLWGEHGLEAKGFAYDESIRVPMYMRWPAHVVPDATDSRLVSNIDLAPTIADAVGGLAPGVPMDGKSMLNMATSRSRMLSEMYFGTLGLPGWAGIRTATSHYVEHYDPVDHETVRYREYYDLTADPYEMDNLLGDGNAANDPPTAALAAQLAADRNCSGTTCP